MHNARRIASLFLLVMTLLPIAARADSAQGLSLTPVIVDERAKARDILKESVTIVNTTTRRLTLYPSVNDVATANGTQPFGVAQNSEQLSGALSNWIEISRAVIELNPGEEKTVPFVIRVNLAARPGTYHAIITFSDGSTRDEATAQPPLATATVNVEVQADVKEVMQMNGFSTDNIVFTGDDVLFRYQLQNIGNQDLQPKGEIRIYDRSGEEVTALDVNAEGKIVQPDQRAQLASVWSAASGFGKYKAMIDIDYGKAQVASVHDTVYFWVVPWKQVLGVSIVSLLAVIALALYFHRWLEDRHFGKLASAGLLKDEAFAMRPEPVSQSHLPGAQPERPALPADQVSVAQRATALIGMLARLMLKRSSHVAFEDETPLPQVAAAVPQASYDGAPVAQSTDGAKSWRDLSRAGPVQNAGTIDLKHIATQSTSQPTAAGHTINLKGGTSLR